MAKKAKTFKSLLNDNEWKGIDDFSIFLHGLSDSSKIFIGSIGVKSLKDYTKKQPVELRDYLQAMEHPNG